MIDAPIQTQRLSLIPAALPLLLAERESAAALGAALGAEVTAEWPPGEYDRGALDFFISALAQQVPEMAMWYLWYAVCPTPQPTLVAAAGFYGPPQAGRVEIGYSVIPAAHNQGFGSEIVSALVAFAFAHGVQEVIAQTTEANVASTRVLERCGFVRTDAGASTGAGQGDALCYRRVAEAQH